MIVSVDYVAVVQDVQQLDQRVSEIISYGLLVRFRVATRNGKNLLGFVLIAI